MAASQHTERLKQIYVSKPSTPAGERVAISYGHAELDAEISASDEGTVRTKLPHQRLLSDVASLAAGSLEKDRFVEMEQFHFDVDEPDYTGPVVASADVVLAEPPRFVVDAILLTETGELVAEATGVFRPGDEALPSTPLPEEADEAPVPEPASFMPVHTTPYGMLCLN